MSNCLGAVEESLLKRRKRTGAKQLRLLYDNFRLHKTKQVKEKLLRMGMIEPEHPPYSPDLALVISISSLSLRNTSLVVIFGKSAELGWAILQYQNGSRRKTIKYFVHWLERLQRCLNNGD
ncbi:hypothetical protein LOD99_10885 [Oopsacas minuta]|uniref:Tc1-like transposase DDE domain-containing protein n=1 Tax=Oopsacas minuta TaxID=111878 RepID=A0AAV7KDI9_9METZ|nr:hypothetical protein LOD99_10885 [Oopsacas minuta]